MLNCELCVPALTPCPQVAPEAVHVDIGAADGVADPPVFHIVPSLAFSSALGVCSTAPTADVHHDSLDMEPDVTTAERRASYQSSGTGGHTPTVPPPLMRKLSHGSGATSGKAPLSRYSAHAHGKQGAWNALSTDVPI